MWLSNVVSNGFRGAGKSPVQSTEETLKFKYHQCFVYLPTKEVNIMKRLKRRVCLVGMIVLVVGLLIVPNVSAFYWTQNPPGDGYHGNPPPATTCDGSGGAQIINMGGVAIAVLSRGGDTPWQPQLVLIQEGRLVFYVEYDNLAKCNDPNLDHVTARVDLVLSRWMFDEEFGWIWSSVDSDYAILIAYQDEQFFEQGHLYVYEIERQYQEGDLYCLSYEATCWYTLEDMSTHMADNMLDMSYYELTETVPD